MIGQAENSPRGGWGAKEKAGGHACCGPGRLPALQQLFRTRLGVPSPVQSAYSSPLTGIKAFP